MTELMPSLCNDCISRNQCGKDDVKMCASYIKEIKIKCDDCKFVENCVDYGWDGCRKFTPTPSEPMTNEEWFCGLSTEEKARFLACEFTVACDDYAYFNNKETWNEKYWLEWLKQPHKDTK